MTKANISWNSRQLAKALTNGSLTSDNAMQRGIVWDRKRQSLLIESILRGFPIPAIYTVRTNEDAPAPAKKGSKVFDLLDGKQRTEALRAYLNDEFELQGISMVEDEDGQLVDIEGKKFSELSESMQDIINTFTFNVYYFSDTSEEEIAEIMYRLNNGRTLTGTEQARIRAKDLNTLIKTAEHSLFQKNFTEKAMKSYSNEDVIIKSLLVLIDGIYDLSAKNVREGYTRYGREEITGLAETLDRTEYMIEYVRITDRKTAKSMTKKNNLVGLVCFAHGHMDLDEDDISDFAEHFFGGENSELTDEEYEKFRKYMDAYSENLMNGANRQANVKARAEAMENAYSIWKERK